MLKRFSLPRIKSKVSNDRASTLSGYLLTAPTRQPDYLHSLQQRIVEARRRSDAIFDMLVTGALYDRPIAERHRLIFYLGHLEAFDWNLLGRGAFELEPENAGFDKLFAFGIDPTNGNLPNDVPSDWPSEKEVRAYNDRGRERIDEAIARGLSGGSVRPDVADGTRLNVAIEHRLMHGETLAYLLHQLPFEKKKRNGARPAVTDGLVTRRTASIPAGVATLGQPRKNDETASSAVGDGFGWDNEFETLSVDIPAFSIDAYPVTNGQFLEFLKAGGYDDRNLWRAEDWEWKSAAGITHPFFWIPRGDAWMFRGMFEEIPLPLTWPVYVSHAEAAAYARWAGKSLPTEAQWHRAAYGSFGDKERFYPWGDESPNAWRGNFDFASWEPTPVASHPLGASAFGVFDLLGNGWEWTSTPFAPLPGFEPFPFYRGYSADFFDGKHFVMKGGSQRTAASMLRRSFRNWFQPHYPYVFAKFRCVES
jgi:gamma-glutamyl hercynylcysteine S-oxide synthase